MIRPLVVAALPGARGPAGTLHGAGPGEGAYEGAFGAVLLSEGADGSARLTVHLADGPLAITYLGRCEAM